MVYIFFFKFLGKKLYQMQSIRYLGDLIFEKKKKKRLGHYFSRVVILKTKISSPH